MKRPLIVFIACTLSGAILAEAQSNYEPYTFTTLTGNAGYGSADGPANDARFFNPRGVAVDSARNVYVADTGNHTIRKITADGVVSTIAGTAGVSGSADGTGSAARFKFPYGVAVDSNGNIYVADQGNGAIRKITPAGVVSTLAGSFAFPQGLAVDSAGNVYVADSGNNAIRKITPAGVVSTLAVGFLLPSGVTVDTARNVYVADTNNHAIRKITPAGVVSTLAAGFFQPTGVAVDSAGNVYVADQRNHTIHKITPKGVVSTMAGAVGVPGSADGTGSAARFDSPFGVTVDNAGNIYVGDTFNDTIRKITPDGVVSTLAGLVGGCGSADGMGSAARFCFPFGVALDTAGNIYVGDNNNQTIRKITPTGVASTVAGLPGVIGSVNGAGSAARFYLPAGVAVDSAENIYVADSGNQAIRKITPAGLVSTLAGLPAVHGSTDGTGSAARFFNPEGVTVDSAGTVYVADTFNHTIRKITPAGVVSTLAGLAGSEGSADGMGNAARFFKPGAVAVDSAGTVYVADTTNDTIRKITPAGVVSTLAGLPTAQGSTDGTGSAARFFGPIGLALDSVGNVYVADSGNSTIRKITPVGVVSTLAGLVLTPGSEDGTGSAARFKLPYGVAVDSAGIVYVADANNHTVRVGAVPLGGNCTICHKGVQTLTLPCNSLDYRRHLDHGDTLGTCQSASEKK